MKYATLLLTTCALLLAQPAQARKANPNEIAKVHKPVPKKVVKKRTTKPTAQAGCAPKPEVVTCSMPNP
ncbi:MAG: hypothetical protein ACRCV6_04265 [Formosimonas sp.]